ncbi:hypothetical protein CVT26_014176 [Gymnopilus dilepis]|uniref:UNC-45/Cro1/She4 central domain-containing protein n=1 Tax=Gymnopilus dilepis TaxID=231916 RepID=A0A409VU15_9AGAR|nr:hypothetical protein CVT26_014176 [Gymnopilus dilepis]
MADTASNTDEILNQILKKSQTSSDYDFKLLPDEIACLTSCFFSSTTTNESSSSLRSKAYVVLSAFCQGLRNHASKSKGKGKEPEDVGTKAIVDAFRSPVLNYLGETNDTSLTHGLSFLTALFQVDPPAASAIFSEEGVIENVVDAVDLSPSPLLSQEVAHLLRQACGQKTCRAVITPQMVRWLEFKSRQTSDPVLQSAAAVALIKLSKGAVSDAAAEGGVAVAGEGAQGSSLTGDVRTEELKDRLVDVVVAGQSASSADAVEGLAYLSTDPTVKEDLSKNEAFLKKLFSLVPSQKAASKPLTDLNSAALIYGVILIIYNLTSFKPRLTEEQKQVEKLKRMTKAGKGLSDAEESSSILDDDDHVKVRIKRLIAAGVLPVFPAAIAATESVGVKANVGRCLLSIVEEKENRGKVLQAGGAKVLQTIIKQAFSSQPADKEANISAADLEAIQALAKLAITSSPVQVFGPNVGALYDAIRPFSTLLQHSSSNLLQRFEAIMALTNLASHSPDVASRIAKVDGLMNKVELLLLEDNTLIRRASVELICNLIAGSDEAFERYSGETANSASKLHVLLALSDEDDVPTRLAASGALATVTAAPSACSALIALQFEKHRFLTLMTQLIDPSAVKREGEEEPLQTNPGLVHRGVVCVGNVFKSIKDAEVREKIAKEAAECGLAKALVQLVQGKGLVKDPAIVQLGMEALKALMDKK